MRKHEIFEKGVSLTHNTASIIIESHMGSWYVIATTQHEGETVFLLEHEEYGDDCAGIICDINCNVILDDVWNGFEDLEDL